MMGSTTLLHSSMEIFEPLLWGAMGSRCRLDGLTWSLLSKAIHSRVNRNPPGVARLQSPLRF